MDTTSHLLHDGAVRRLRGGGRRRAAEGHAATAGPRAAEIFGSLVGAALVLGWILYFFPL